MQSNQAKTPCPNCKEVRVHKFQGVGDVDDKRGAVIELWQCECCNRNYYRVRTKDNKNIGFFKDVRDWKEFGV